MTTKSDTADQQRSFRVTSIYVLILLTVQPSKQVQDQTVTDDIISFNNFGVYLIPQSVAYVSTNSWHHLFHFILPVPNMTQVRARDLNCSAAIAELDDVQLCAHANFMMQMYMQFEQHILSSINAVVKQMYSILPDAANDNLRQKRGWFDLGGTILSKVFGLTTESDMNKIRAVVNEMGQTSAATARAFQLTSRNLASFMRLTTQQFGNLSSVLHEQEKTLKLVIKRYSRLQKLYQVSHETLYIAIGRLATFVTTLDELRKFSQALSLATHRILTSDIIPLSDMKLAIRKVGQEVRRKTSNLHPLTYNVVDVYTRNNFHIWRESQSVFISVAFPLSPVGANVMTLYEILTTSVPVPNKTNQFTKIQELPKYAAWNPAAHLFVTFDDKPAIRNSLLDLKFTRHVLSHGSTRSCMSTLLSKNAADISSTCLFTLSVNERQPSVLKLDRRRLLLMNVSENFLYCHTPTNSRVRKFMTSPHFELTVPCGCDFDSAAGIYPAENVHCESLSSNAPKVHPVNYALLQKFFTQADLASINVQSRFNHSMVYEIPNLPIYTSKYSHELASVETHNLELQKVAEAGKHQSLVFQELADKMMFDVEHSKLRIESSSLSLTSWQNMLYMSTMALTAILIVWCITMHIRLKTLIAAGNLRTHTVKGEGS